MEKHVTGLPVINKEHQVVGVVSDFDLLAIDLPEDPRHNIFPSIDQSWEVHQPFALYISRKRSSRSSTICKTSFLRQKGNCE